MDLPAPDSRADVFVRAVELHQHPSPWQDFDVVGRALREARDELDRITREAVARARGRGEPWSRIGDALGVTRQSAHQKYGDHAA